MKPPCTVEKYLAVLSSKLTQYDVRESGRETKRGGRPNIYRLGHLLDAAHQVREDVGSHRGATPEELERFRQSMMRRFDPAFPPVRKVLRQMDKGICKLT